MPQLSYRTSELLLLISKSQIALDFWNEVEFSLKNAQYAVKKLGSLRSEWQVEYLLGRCALHNEMPAKVDDYFDNSKQSINYILEHISDDNLRRHFTIMQFVLDSVVETG